MYYYITTRGAKTIGMTSSGSFTADRTRWMTFTDNEAQMPGIPYGATMAGAFVRVDKF